VRRALTGALTRELTADELHGFIDRLQRALARINDELARTYFSPDLPLPQQRQMQDPPPLAESTGSRG
jgi:hypothetical protein